MADRRGVIHPKSIISYLLERKTIAGERRHGNRDYDRRTMNYELISIFYGLFWNNGVHFDKIRSCGLQ